MLLIMVTGLGYAGMVMLAVGFYLISSGKLEARNIIYQTIQCFGCLFIALDSLFKGAYPSVVLQIVCICIAIQTINSIINEKAKELESKNG